MSSEDENKPQLSASSPDSAYAPLVTRTAYPYGTDNHTVTTDPRGVETTTRTYDGSNAEVTETVSGGVTNRTTEVWGGATTVEKFWDGKWTRETRSTSYNAGGCRVEIVTAEASDMPAAVVTSQTAYDFLNRTVSVTAPLGVTSNFYDGASDRVIRVSRVSRTGSPDTLYIYDELGNIIETVLDADGNGQVSYAGTDRIGTNGTRYEGDTNAWWRVTSQAQSCGGATNSASEVWAQVTGLSPALLSLTETVSPDNMTATVTRAFEPGTDIIVETSQTGTAALSVRRTLYGHELESAVPGAAMLSAYDGFTRTVSQTVTNGTGTLSITAVAYDTLGNAVTNQTAYGSLASVTVTSYDNQGRAMSQTDALDNTVETVYDSFGQALALSGATYPVTYTYDTAGRMTALSTTRDGAAWDTTLWLYDNATGLLTNKVYADGSRVSYSYTPSGKPARTTWARGTFKENGWDWLGHLTGTTYSTGTPTAFNAYTSAGFLAASSNAVARYLYQNADSGVATNTAVFIGTNAFAITKLLDPFLRLSVLDTGSTQSPMFYGFNIENALASVSNAAFSLAYQFDGAFDMGHTVTLSNGTTVTRAVIRDPYRRHLVTCISNVIGGSVYSAIACGHDLLGNVTNRNGDAVSYNPRSEVSGAVIGSDLFNYSYDGIGNLVWSAENALTNTYSANNLNQYTAISVPASEPQYDADGNLTAIGQLSLTWDAENRMTGAASNGVPVVTSGYDPQHRRVVKTTPSGTTIFLYDGWLPVLEKLIRADGTAEVREHVRGKDLSGTRGGGGGVGGLLATRIGGAWYFPLCDMNGNVTDYINESGANVAHREYGPFGETLAATGSMVNVFNFWFSTKYLDHETGFYYYGYRFYSPELRRFINRDPIEERGGLNLSGFVRNDPINRWDYLGHTECKCAQERIWMELGEKMREASSLTLQNPITIDANYDKAVSRIPLLLKAYREYGGYICCNKKAGKVSSTGPYPGTWRYTSKDGKEFYSDNPVLLAKGGGTPTTGNITSDSKKQCPAGTTTILFYHSHPPNSPNLSPSDVGYSNTSGGPIAGGAAGIDFYWVYSPSYGWIIVEY